MITDIQVGIDKLLTHLNVKETPASSAASKNDKPVSPSWVRQLYDAKLKELRKCPVNSHNGNPLLNDTALIAARVCASGVFPGKPEQEFKQELFNIVTVEWTSPHDANGARETIKSGWTKGASEGPYILDENEPDLPEVTQPYPSFPRLIGVLDQLALAIAPSLAYEQKALGLLVIVGLQISVNHVCRLATDPWLQPRFYGCGISPPGQTKSAADKELRHALYPHRDLEGTSKWPPLPGPEITVEFSVNSGPALVQLLSELPRGERGLLIAPDELAGMFEKARSTQTSPNTLFNELLRLYEGNETGRTVVQRRGEKGTHIKLDDAHIAIYGGATPQSFEKMWQGTGGDGAGLQSRFVLAYSDCPLPAFQKLTNEDEVRRFMTLLSERLRETPKTLTMTADAQQLVHDWVANHNGQLPARAIDTAKRGAMIISATDSAGVIDIEAIRWGLAFADYQIELKKRLMPSDASTSVQGFENRIIGIYERNPQATLRQLRRALHPERYPGGYDAYERAVSSLIHSGRLRAAGKTRSNTKIYELD